jgi:hypothetical protein
MHQPQPEEVMAALQSVVLDRRTHIINTPDGKACMMPVEDYIRLVEMGKYFRVMACQVRNEDMVGLRQSLEEYATWLLEGGGNDYVRGDTDAYDSTM